MVSYSVNRAKIIIFYGIDHHLNENYDNAIESARSSSRPNDGSLVLIDILHHQYSARPSSTTMVETTELMNRYLTIADTLQDGF